MEISTHLFDNGSIDFGMIISERVNGNAAEHLKVARPVFGNQEGTLTSVDLNLEAFVGIEEVLCFPLDDVHEALSANI
jgi:hypothetical protein